MERTRPGSRHWRRAWRREVGGSGSSAVRSRRAKDPVSGVGHRASARQCSPWATHSPCPPPPRCAADGVRCAEAASPTGIDSISSRIGAGATAHTPISEGHPRRGTFGRETCPDPDATERNPPRHEFHHASHSRPRPGALEFLGPSLFPRDWRDPLGGSPGEHLRPDARRRLRVSDASRRLARSPHETSGQLFGAELRTSAECQLHAPVLFV